MSDPRVIITDESSGKSLELPVIKGTEGEPCLQIKALPSTLGYFTYDPGFTATASCTSKITFIDGGKGILRYRGYPIEQLAEKSTFLEVAYLLLSGELPTSDEFEEFEKDITYHTMIHERLNTFINGFHYDAHPMAMMAGVVGSLAAFYHDKMDMKNPEHRMLAAKRMIAKMPTIAAACYRHHMGWPTAYPKNYSELHGTLSGHDVLGTRLRNIKSTRLPPRHSICCLYCMLIMSKTPAHPLSGWSVQPVPILMPVLPQVYRHCGVLHMAAPMKRC